MACSLPQPSIVAEGHLPDDIEKLVGFILHGVTHILHDNKGVPRTYFATINDGKNMIVFDTRTLPTLDIEHTAINKVVTDQEATLLACLTEAWTLPEEMRDAQYNGTSGYPDIEANPHKYEILMITVESADGIWMMHERLHHTELGKRYLPDTVKFDKIPEDVRPHPGFVRLLSQKAPVSVSLH